MQPLINNRGMSLVELTAIIIVVGIITAIAMQSMTAQIEDVRQAKTEREMQTLADAIVGNPEILQNGHRADFGYVGDIGSFPPNLAALSTNPGYATWDGPYLPGSIDQDATGAVTDEWGSTYNYSGGITITSTGSGSTINKKIADAASDYLLNSVSGTILDENGDPPGTGYADSVTIRVSFPNGAGGIASKTYHPESDGQFLLDSLPVGTHTLNVIFIPDSDTLHRFVTILPRNKGQVRYLFAADYFSGGGGGGGGGGTVIYEEFTEAKRSSAEDNLDLDTPPGTSAGDLLIAVVITDASENISPPGGQGWTLISHGDGSNQVTVGVWWKLAGASEPNSHEFSWNSSEEAYGFMMRFTGHDPSTPINASASDDGSNSSSPPAPSVTTTADNCMILRIGGFDDDDITTDNTGLSGHTDITMDQSSSGNGTCSGGAGYEYLNSAGPSGSASFSIGSGEQWRTVTVAIAPAP